MILFKMTRRSGYWILICHFSFSKLGFTYFFHDQKIKLHTYLHIFVKNKKSYSHPTLCYCNALNFIYPLMKSACFPWFIDLKCAGWLSERKPRSNEAGSDWPFVYCFDLDCVMLLVISENNYPPFNCARHPSRSQQCWDIIVLSRRHPSWFHHHHGSHSEIDSGYHASLDTYSL